MAGDSSMRCLLPNQHALLGLFYLCKPVLGVPVVCFCIKNCHRIKQKAFIANVFEIRVMEGNYHKEHLTGNREQFVG